MKHTHFTKFTNTKRIPNVSNNIYTFFVDSDNGVHVSAMMSSSIATSSKASRLSDNYKYTPLSPSLIGPDSTVSTLDIHVTLATSSSDDVMVTSPLSDSQRTAVQHEDSITEDLVIQTSTPLDQVRVDTSSDSAIDQHYPPRQLWNPFLQPCTVATNMTARQHQEIDTSKNNLDINEQSSVKSQKHNQNDHNTTIKMKSSKKRKLVSVISSQSQIFGIQDVIANTRDEMFQTSPSPRGAILSQSPSSSTSDAPMTMLSECPSDAQPSGAATQSAKITRPSSTCTPDSSSNCIADDNATKDLSLDATSTISETTIKSTDTMVTTVTSLDVRLQCDQ